jgi:hypothetical protein
MVENDFRFICCSEAKASISLQDEKVTVSGSGIAC